MVTYTTQASVIYRGIHLTKMEVECLLCLILGNTAKEIGEFLSIPSHAVESYLNNSKHKLKAYASSEPKVLGIQENQPVVFKVLNV